MPDLLTGFALVAVVLTIAGLASGFVERAPLSFPIIFLGLGFCWAGTASCISARRARFSRP